jgi:hypothetical protein
VVTPVPIPNTEVKRCSGDDSPIGAKVASRQNQVFNSHLARRNGGFLLLAIFYKGGVKYKYSLII